ncbi:hypothetical protein D3C80_1852690 [compost metagenome]
MQANIRLAETVVEHFKLIKRQPIANTGAKRLGDGFFHRKTFGQKAYRLLMLLVQFPFSLAQHAARETIATALNDGFNARHFDNVGTQPQHRH